MAPTIVDENELRIPALHQSEFPSDAIGNIFSRAWDESELGFHHFNFLNAYPRSIIHVYILAEKVDVLGHSLQG